MEKEISNPSRKPSIVCLILQQLPESFISSRVTYNEKIFLDKHNITIEGEDRDKTIITFDIARDEWRCDHPSDWGVATMNVNGNDITLKNLTIANDYGFNFLDDRVVSCAADTPTLKRTITRERTPDGIADNGHYTFEGDQLSLPCICG
jgi:pectinesterase